MIEGLEREKKKKHKGEQYEGRMKYSVIVKNAKLLGKKRISRGRNLATRQRIEWEEGLSLACLQLSFCL